MPSLSEEQLKELLKMDLLPKFTDDYIDEWISEGNDISKLHTIIDNFADELATIFHQYGVSERVDELKNVPNHTSVNLHVRSRIKELTQSDSREGGEDE